VALTAIKIKSAKAKNKKYKLSDGGGLFLQINSNGSKLWRLKYRFNGKEKEYAIGKYPDISLARAREHREQLRTLIADNIDPNAKKKEQKEIVEELEFKKHNTFYNVSQEWWKHYKREVSENYHTKLGKALENYIYPYIKHKSIEQIKRKDILEVMMALKEKSLYETAKRVFILLNQIFKYAVVMERIEYNIIVDLDKKIILGKIAKKHYPTMTNTNDIKGLLLAIDDYNGDYTTKQALKMLPYVFVRSFNIRHCEWDEIDFKNKVWIIPSYKMKIKKEFILPLPPQVIKILKDAQQFSGDGRYVFPSFRAKDKPMSDNTMISALRRMGYTKDEIVPHSFRSIFSTIAHEKANDTNDGHTYTSEVIEALLAHSERNKVKDTYNHSSYKEAMRGLIEWYATYLDNIKNTP
jgi:integrase